MLLTLAWRNIWRNKRRTLITMASIFLAVLPALVMRSMQLGTYERMIDNSVKYYTGHLQIMQSGYWEDKTLNNSLEEDTALIHRLRTHKQVRSVLPRVESFALSSTENQSKGVRVVGTQPAAEARMTGVDEQIKAGRYLEAGEEAVVVGTDLADFLGLRVGDTLVLLGQGYHGVMAAGKYPIVGLASFSMPDMRKNFVLMPLQTAQRLFSLPGRLTSISVEISSLDAIESLPAELTQSLDASYNVMNWRELMPELVQFIELDNVGGLIMLWILYLVIAFGIFGTVVMMTMERQREFGVLQALGMRRYRIIYLLAVEMAVLSSLALLAAMVIAWPILAWYSHHPVPISGELADSWEELNFEPVMAFSQDPGMFLAQAQAIGLMVLLSLLYPLWRIYSTPTIDALRNQL